MLLLDLGNGFLVIVVLVKLIRNNVVMILNRVMKVGNSIDCDIVVVKGLCMNLGSCNMVVFCLVGLVRVFILLGILVVMCDVMNVVMFVFFSIVFSCWMVLNIFEFVLVRCGCRLWVVVMVSGDYMNVLVMFNVMNGNISC